MKMKRFITDYKDFTCLQNDTLEPSLVVVTWSADKQLNLTMCVRLLLKSTNCLLLQISHQLYLP